ncbi:hypothetical protein RMCBS344292_06623 [Rhizopus microsporus]|nr:hypothetical protein RMCBS344292_06623 [Rhizopus microsporus]
MPRTRLIPLASPPQIAGQTIWSAFTTMAKRHIRALLERQRPSRPQSTQPKKTSIELPFLQKIFSTRAIWKHSLASSPLAQQLHFI